MQKDLLKLVRENSEGIIDEQTALSILIQICNSTMEIIENKESDALAPGLIVVYGNDYTDFKVTTLDIDVEDMEEGKKVMQTYVEGLADSGTQAVLFIFGVEADLEEYDEDGNLTGTIFGFILRAITFDGRSYNAVIPLQRTDNGLRIARESDEPVVKVHVGDNVDDDVMKDLQTSFIMRYVQRNVLEGKQEKLH